MSEELRASATTRFTCMQAVLSSKESDKAVACGCTHLRDDRRLMLARQALLRCARHMLGLGSLAPQVLACARAGGLYSTE